MTPHSSTLAWKIPWVEEPGRLQSMGSQRVRHDSLTSLSLFTFMHWRRKWQSTPVLLPGKSRGWRILVGYSPQGRKEWDTTERLNFQLFMCSCHLFLTSSASVRSTISVLYCAHLCMKCSLGISNFLEISSLSLSVVFLYFFALIAEEGFLISPCYSWKLCIQMLISFLFFFCLQLLFFSQLSATIQMNPENIMQNKRSPSLETTYDFTYMKCPEQANL